MRIVFDTNIFIAAALKGGFSENIMEMAAARIVMLITSEEILAELKQKLLAKFYWRENEADFFISYIRKISEIIPISETVSVISRDPDDNKILACAKEGKANLIVSADQDLIKLKVFEGVAIIHPKTLSYTFPKYFKE
jgi:putative PIN family toxin of toxin-antitoxin system